MKTGVYFMPDRARAECCMLAKNPVILEPAWPAMTLRFSDYKATIQQVASGLVSG